MPDSEAAPLPCFPAGTASKLRDSASAGRNGSPLAFLFALADLGKQGVVVGCHVRVGRRGVLMEGLAILWVLERQFNLSVHVCVRQRCPLRCA